MASTFGILETAKSGLSVAMQNQKITGHNIANANTVGYTRQRVITSAKESNAVYLIKPMEENRVGQGVEVISIQQVRSEYLDSQYRELNAKFSYSDSATQSLTYLEGLFNSELTAGEGLTGSIEDFFSAINTLAGNTTSEENRIALQKSAISLTQNFNLVYQEMESLWEDQNTSISTVAQTVNSLATKLVELNKAIARYERTGEAANDLRDERNLMLDELSGYVNITIENNASNPSMVDVSIGGVALVDGTSAYQLEVSNLNTELAGIADLNAQIAASTDPTEIADIQTEISNRLAQINAKYSVSLTSAANAGNAEMRDISLDGTALVTGSVAVSVESARSLSLDEKINFLGNRLSLGGTELRLGTEITGGDLSAHMEMVTSKDSGTPGIPYYMQQLNKLARSIAKNINDIHKEGYSYDTSTTGTSNSANGLYFFNVETEDDGYGNITEQYDNITAGNFSISSSINDSVWNIACSDVQVDVAKTNTGNSEIITKMYADLASSRYYGTLNGVVGHLSIALATNKSILNTRQSLLNSVDAQRSSVSGVSRDEETTNLIVYQQAYNACSRVISAIDEMLDVMINSMGTVGR
ncbi:hypothetical protein SDC9_62252 [bioreactor metagenome]|uniref:Flagellar hook-associated protein 1 n=1 Tax=bioreactor metagenome TaxID=1076179 RepID=A0A644XJ97_9ZZZZ